MLREAEVNAQTLLLQKLRSPDNKTVLRAVKELRARGRLSTDTLVWAYLQYAHLQGADLRCANLRKADLCMANLQGANLEGANLEDARLNKVNLCGADLSGADLKGAVLTNANLQQARGIGDEQFIQTNGLRGATLPDGGLYDGRFNLAGDIAAARFLRVDPSNPEAIADFYGVSLEDYLLGRQWAHAHVPDTCVCPDDIVHTDVDSILVRIFGRTIGDKYPMYLYSLS